MDDDTSQTASPAPYNYQLSQQRLAQQYALAQALMSTQQPAAGQINHANIGGAQYSFFVPNKGGVISAALQKALGGYMMSKANKASTQDAQNQQTAIQKALASLQPSTSVGSAPAPLSPSQQSNLTAANAPSASAPGLSGIDTSGAQGEQLQEAPPAPSDYMHGIMNLEQAGPMGQGLAQRYMTPPKFFQNPNTGAITGVDPYTGQQISQAGGGGVNPKMARTYLQVLTNADVTNPQGYQAGLTAARGLGLIGPSDAPSPQNLAAIQSGARQQQQAGTANKQSSTNLNTQRAAVLPAQVAATTQNAQTNSDRFHLQQTTTLPELATKKSTADGQSAEYANLLTQLQQAESYITPVTAGKYGNAAGGLAAYYGNSAKTASMHQLLESTFNNTILQGITQDEAGSGRGPNAQLFEGYSKHSINADSTPAAQLQYMKLMQTVLARRKAASDATSAAYGDTLKSLGYNPPQQPQAPEPSPMGAATATGPNGQKLALVNGQWAPQQ
jgi:hypothetical protein